MRLKSKTNVLRKGISSMAHKDFDYFHHFVHNFHWYHKTFHSQKDFPLWSFFRAVKASVDCWPCINTLSKQSISQESRGQALFIFPCNWHQPLSPRRQSGSRHGSPLGIQLGWKPSGEIGGILLPTCIFLIVVCLTLQRGGLGGGQTCLDGLRLTCCFKAHLTGIQTNIWVTGTFLKTQGMEAGSPRKRYYWRWRQKWEVCVPLWRLGYSLDALCPRWNSWSLPLTCSPPRVYEARILDVIFLLNSLISDISTFY